MRYIKTNNGNYIVESIDFIKLPHKESRITRYAFFSASLKFIKLTEFLVWKSIAENKKILNTEDADSIDSSEEVLFFHFPSLFKYHFVEEVKAKDKKLLRLFYKWTVHNNHIYPNLILYLENNKILDLKYDLFSGKILEKNHLYDHLISQSRNAAFPNWTKYLMFNAYKKYREESINIINKFSNSI